MRLKQLVLTLLVLAPALGAQEPLILLVHGRGQSGRDSAQFRRDAMHALETSLHHVDAPFTLDPRNVQLIWYADVLDARADGSSSATCPANQVSAAIRERESAPSALSVIAMLAGPLFDAASRDAKGDDANDLRSLSGDLRFLADFDTRCAAERRVTDALRDAHQQHRPVILISHSLGALVTWSALAHQSEMRDTTIGTIDRWITIGSPLGSPEIRQLIFGDDHELARPASIRKWVNVVGTDDPFAVRLGTSPVDAIEDLTTQRAHTDPHHILSYLEDEATARVVMDAWEAATKH